MSLRDRLGSEIKIPIVVKVILVIIVVYFFIFSIAFLLFVNRSLNTTGYTGLKDCAHTKFELDSRTGEGIINPAIAVYQNCRPLNAVEFISLYFIYMVRPDLFIPEFMVVV